VSTRAKPDRSRFIVRDHLIPRSLLAAALCLLLGAFTPPAEAVAVASVVLLACFTTSSLRRLGWVIAAALGMAIGGLISWGLAGGLVLLDLLGVPLFLVACDMLGLEQEEMGDALGFGGRVLSLLTLGTWFPTLLIIVGTVAVAYAESSWSSLAIAAVPCYLEIRRHHWLSLLSAVIVGLVWWFPDALLVPMIVAAVALIWPHLPRRVRPSVVSLPHDFRHAPFVSIRLWKVDRLLYRGDIDGAESRLHRWHLATERPLVRLRRRYVALEKGLYQEALSEDDASQLTDRVGQSSELLNALALLAIARSADAASRLERLTHEQLGHRTRISCDLALAEGLLETGDSDGAVAYATSVIKEGRHSPSSADSLRAHRYLAEALRRKGEIDEAAAVVTRGLIRVMTGWRSTLMDGSRLDSLMTGARGRQFLEIARLFILDVQISRAAGSLKPEKLDEFLFNEGLSSYFAMSGEWKDYADAQLLMADLFLEQNAEGATKKGLAASLRALRELDRHRYDLHSQVDRAAWSSRFQQALSVSLPLAERSSLPALTAELVELARIQALPLVSSGVSGAEVVLAPAPIVRARGKTSIARYADSNRPPPVDLEIAAMSTAGFGAWWLSYWRSRDSLYWSLVPPRGEVFAGSLAASADSELSKLLAALHQAVPIREPDESEADLDVRMAASPLIGSHASESALSSMLSDAILPEPLVGELRRRHTEGAPPLPLAISPAPELAFVPWALLRVDLGGKQARLVATADFVLAPSASLAVELGRRAKTPNRCPLRLAVLDTTDSPELPALPGARSLARILPPSVTVLGGPHWTGDLATKARLKQALSEAGKASSALFACHAVRGLADQPSMGGLVAASDDGLRRSVLTASDVIALAESRDHVPAQVVLQACDTSDLSSSSSGEWLTIAPAFLTAGANVVVSTLFPLADTDESDNPIISAVVRGDDLRKAVRDMQIERAARWDDPQSRHGTIADSPVVWGAYVTCSCREIQEDAGRRSFGTAH
jgi:tetratricopeptide (TPR) repeat protein